MGASRKLQLLEFDKGSFYNQAHSLWNTNMIRAYITIIKEMTLMRRVTKVTGTLILKKTAILIAKVTGTAKIIKHPREILMYP